MNRTTLVQGLKEIYSFEKCLEIIKNAIADGIYEDNRVLVIATKIDNISNNYEFDFEWK